MTSSWSNDQNIQDIFDTSLVQLKSARIEVEKSFFTGWLSSSLIIDDIYKGGTKSVLLSAF